MCVRPSDRLSVCHTRPRPIIVRCASQADHRQPCCGCDVTVWVHMSIRLPKFLQLPDVSESSDADGDVVSLVLEVVERLDDGPVTRGPDRADRLAEPDVRRHGLEQPVERADLARVEHQRLPEEVLVAVAKQSDLARRRRRHERRRHRQRSPLSETLAIL